MKEWIATLTSFARNDMRVFSCHYEEREARSIVIAKCAKRTVAIHSLFLLLATLLLLPCGSALAANSGGGNFNPPNASDYTGTLNNINPTSTGGNVFIDSDVTGVVRGGYINSTSTNVTGNTVTITSGTMGGSVYGGQVASGGTGNATNNTVNINGGTFSSSFIYGGYVVSSGGNASNNTVNITGGTTLPGIRGGYADSNGNVTGNTVTITGGTFRANTFIYGGYANGTGSATGNTVSISGGTFGTTTFYGGFGTSATDIRTGNTLEIRSVGISAKAIGNFQHLRFYLPASVKANDIMLTLSDAVDISTPTTGSSLGATTVGVGIMGGSSLAMGDTVTLIKSGVSLTADADMKNTATGMSGISKVYEFELETTATELNAKVSKISPSAEAIRKSPAEGKAASVTLVTQGADLIAGKGMSSAREAAQAVGVGAGGLGVAGFGAMNGGTSTYKTGSHVDVTGFSLMAGLAKRLPLSGVDALAGVFFEAGWGSYNSYNDAPNGTEIKGWGNSRYYGGGIMGRLEWTEGMVKGLYTEASVRLGGLHSDYKSDDLNPALGRASYETNATYYGAHAGLGYVWEFNEKASLDLYGKYFWTHTTGNSVRILGDPVTFDAVNSHRTRVGARFIYAINNYIAPYIGAAWEYEFNGDARSTVAGQSVAAPSLRGSTGVGEIGLRWKPAANSAFSVDIGAQGYVGMRQGVAGNVQLKFEF